MTDFTADLLKAWGDYSRRQRLKGETTQRIPAWFLLGEGADLNGKALFRAWQEELAAFGEPEDEGTEDRRDYQRDRREAIKAGKWWPRPYNQRR